MTTLRVASLVLFLGLTFTNGFSQQSPTTEEIRKGAAVYAKKCMRCQSLRRAAGSEVRWKETIERERKKDPGWLTDEEARVLLIYLQNPPL